MVGHVYILHTYTVCIQSTAGQTGSVVGGSAALRDVCASGWTTGRDHFQMDRNSGPGPVTTSPVVRANSDRFRRCNTFQRPVLSPISSSDSFYFADSVRLTLNRSPIDAHYTVLFPDNTADHLLLTTAGLHCTAVCPPRPRLPRIHEQKNSKVSNG